MRWHGRLQRARRAPSTTNDSSDSTMSLACDRLHHSRSNKWGSLTFRCWTRTGAGAVCTAPCESNLVQTPYFSKLELHPLVVPPPSPQHRVGSLHSATRTRSSGPPRPVTALYRADGLHSALCTCTCTPGRPSSPGCGPAPCTLHPLSAPGPVPALGRLLRTLHSAPALRTVPAAVTPRAA